MKHNVWLVLAAALAAMGCEQADEGEEVTMEEQRGESARRAEQEGATTEQGRTAADRERQAAQQQRAQEQQRAQQQQQQIPQTAQIDVRTQEPFGQYLADAQGRSLYMFTSDTRRQSSECYDQCAEMWPPVLTRQDPRAAGQAVQGNMLGTIERRDGSRQVTYNGWPLYTYVRDTRPGQTTGQDVQAGGGEWYLMAPSGERIETEPQQQRAAR